MKLRISKLVSGWAAAIAIVILATGCVTPKSAQKTPPAPAPLIAPKAEQEAPPGLLPDGRDGFLITETARMSTADRRAFDEAVELLNTETYDKAIEILKNIVAHDPGVTAPYINLGIAYARTDKAEEAEAQFKKALEMVPGHPVAGNACGLLFRSKGRFEEARKIYESVLDAYPNYYPVQRNLGILCDLYLNDLASAMAHYEIYSQAMPKDEQVKLWIADLKSRMGG